MTWRDEEVENEIAKIAEALHRSLMHRSYRVQREISERDELGLIRYSFKVAELFYTEKQRRREALTWRENAHVGTEHA